MNLGSTPTGFKGAVSGQGAADQVTVVVGSYVLTMGPAGDIVDGAVAFDRLSGVILAVGTATDVLSAYPGAEKVGGENDIVVPGFINTHDHLSEGLISGVLKSPCASTHSKPTPAPCAAMAETVPMLME